MTPSRPKPLLSRVADAVYWMGRYTERAENVARFIGVNQNLMLDSPRGGGDQWQPIVDTTGDRAAFLEPGMRLSIEFVEGRPVSVLFPDVLEVKIHDTAPPSRQQADSAFKPATFANGIEVMVPQFVKSGDTIRLDLRSLRYMDRAKARTA